MRLEALSWRDTVSLQTPSNCLLGLFPVQQATDLRPTSFKAVTHLRSSYHADEMPKSHPHGLCERSVFLCDRPPSELYRLIIRIVQEQ